jgi:mannonate dehydratase
MSNLVSTETEPPDFESLPLRVGLGQFMEPTQDRLRFVRQLGVQDVILNMYQYDPEYAHMPQGDRMPLDPNGEWSAEQLVALRDRVESAGVRLTGIENVPISFYDDVMTGGDRRDEQLERMKRTVRNIGKAGIPMFGYHWSPTGVARTSSSTVRGGATVSAYDHAENNEQVSLDRRYSEAELWDNFERFLGEIVPVAEEAGVKLCLHPNDPPVESRGGVPQLFRNLENFKRAMDLVPSDHHGLDLCLGSWSQMGADLEEVIRYFGEREEIFYVHFRDVEGTVPSFRETWIGAGNYDALEVMRLLRDVGFSGMMIPDHTPHVVGDTEWNHRGRAYTVGYLRSLIRCVQTCE